MQLINLLVIPKIRKHAVSRKVLVLDQETKPMKTTIDYLKERYTEEKSRFDHFENKSSKLLSFITVLIAALTTLAGINSGKLLNPSGPIAWLALTTFFLGGLSIICAWGHALLSLRVGDIPTMPKSRSTAEYLSAVDEDAKQQHIYNCYIDTLEELAISLDEKSINLELAYNELVISAWMLGIAAALFIATEITI